MKISDDYRAKIRLWAMRPTVVALPPGPPLPSFTSQRFHTHEELNQWKKAQLRKLAQAIVRHNEFGTPVPCLSGPRLLAAKRAANRPQDQADIEFLAELQRLGKL